MSVPIDNVDFCILRCVKDADRALWKKKLHQRIIADKGALPMQDDVSAQTIGRHVDKLEDDQYLESTIASTEDVNRHLLIGYEITADGERLLDEKRRTLLKRIVSQELFTDDTFPIDKPALAQLIHNEFTAGLAINDATDGYTRQQLLLLLGMYLIEQDVLDAFNAEQRKHLWDAVREEL